MFDTWEKVLDPNFINAEIIGPVGTERVVTIKDIIDAEAFNQKTQKAELKRTLVLEECRPMVLNKTNIKTLIKLFGGESPEKCVGKKIVLYVVNVKVGGHPTTGIRIKEYVEETIKCADCGKTIKGAAGKTAKELAAIALRNCGRELCLDCMRKVKEEQDNAK